MSIAEVLRVATPQHGCITRSQALELVTPGRFRVLVRNGTLQQRWPTVYVLAGFRKDWMQTASGVTLSIPGSALSFGAAARLWGFDLVDGSQIEFMTEGPVKYRRPGAIHHRTNMLTGFTTVREGIVITTAARTIVDLSRRLTHRQVGALIDKACILKISSAAGVAACLDKMHRQGRRRSTRIDEALEPRLMNDKDIDSLLEKRTLDWIRQNNLPEPETQFWFRGNRWYRLDIWYPDLKINIEPNGPWHLLPSIALEDAKRDADLSTRGIIVIRVPLDMEQHEFVPLLTAAIASRR